MNTENWIVLGVYLAGIIPAGAWFMWLDRDSMFPSPVGSLFLGFAWPALVPIALIFLAFVYVAESMWTFITGRKP